MKLALALSLSSTCAGDNIITYTYKKITSYPLALPQVHARTREHDNTRGGRAGAGEEGARSTVVVRDNKVDKSVEGRSATPTHRKRANGVVSAERRPRGGEGAKARGG